MGTTVGSKFISVTSHGKHVAVPGPSGNYLVPAMNSGKGQGTRSEHIFSHSVSREWNTASAHVSEVPEQLQ